MGRGPDLVIQAYVPADQSSTEVVVTAAEAMHALRHTPELLSRERRVDCCKALIGMVEFFSSDGKRYLLFNKKRQPRLPADVQTGGGVENPEELGASHANPGKEGLHGHQEQRGEGVDTVETGISQDGAFDASTETDMVLTLGTLFEIVDPDCNGMLRKQQWLAAATGNDRLRDYLAPEIICSRPELKSLRNVTL